MRLSRRYILLLLPLAVPAFGQWFRYPTTNVPRTATGEPNMKAPAPRSTDGHPDFSGVWIADDPAPCPESLGGKNCIEKMPLSRQTRDIGVDVPGGLPYQPWAKTLVDERTKNSGKDDPHVRCLPPNYPRAYWFPHYQRFMQSPGILVMMNEFNASWRQVYTDNRPFPDDPQPAWNGYASAKWEGDTLVIESMGYRDNQWLDMKGSPITDAAHVTERLKRTNFGTIELEVTVNDPKAYTKAWTVKARLLFALDTELVDEICLENEKSAQHMPK